MTAARKTAEPSEEAPPEEPGGAPETIDKATLKEAILEVLAELEAPGPEELGIPEEKLDKPEGPQTLRQIEEAAERIVRAAQEKLVPPKKEEKDEKAEPERPPQPANRLREFIWGKE